MLPPNRLPWIAVCRFSMVLLSPSVSGRRKILSPISCVCANTYLLDVLVNSSSWNVPAGTIPATSLESANAAYPKSTSPGANTPVDGLSVSSMVTVSCGWLKLPFRMTVAFWRVSSSVAVKLAGPLQSDSFHVNTASSPVSGVRIRLVSLSIRYVRSGTIPVKLNVTVFPSDVLELILMDGSETISCVV